MSCSTIAQEIRKALKKESVNNSDVFAVVTNDTLYGVTFASIIAQLGVTGTLTDGSANTSAVPVLSGTAPNFVIRGVAGGNGIGAQAGPNGDIILSVSMVNAGRIADGAQILQSNTAQQFALRRVKAGNGIRVVQNNDNIVIENTEVAVSNDTVIISQLADFPDPVGGVITLQDDKDYLLVANVATSSRFALGQNTVVRGVDPRITTLTYTGTGYMFTLPDGEQAVKELRLECQNGSLIDSTGNQTGSLLFKWVRIGACKNLGVWHKPVVGIYNTYIDTLTGQGFVFGGDIARFKIEGFILGNVTSASCVVLDLNDVVLTSFSVEDIEIFGSVTGSIFMSGLPDGGNLNTSVVGTISNINLQGAIDALSGIDYVDVGWDFSRCNTIPTTSPNALTYLSTADTVSIGAANTPVVIDGDGNFAEHNAWHFDTNVNGRITYRGKRTAQRDINAEVTLEPSSGTNKAITLYVAKNGAVILGSAITSVVSAGSRRNISLIWSDLMSTGDFYEVYVSNQTDTTSIAVSRCILRAD